jgi:hypothetical protein
MPYRFRQHTELSLTEHRIMKVRKRPLKDVRPQVAAGGGIEVRLLEAFTREQVGAAPLRARFLSTVHECCEEVW